MPNINKKWLQNHTFIFQNLFSVRFQEKKFEISPLKLFFEILLKDIILKRFNLFFILEEVFFSLLNDSTIKQSDNLIIPEIVVSKKDEVIICYLFSLNIMNIIFIDNNSISPLKQTILSSDFQILQNTMKLVIWMNQKWKKFLLHLLFQFELFSYVSRVVDSSTLHYRSIGHLLESLSSRSYAFCNCFFLFPYSFYQLIKYYTIKRDGKFKVIKNLLV